MRVRVRGGPLGDELGTRFGPEVAAKATAGEVVDQHGAVLEASTVLAAGASVYLYRDLRDEVSMPFDLSMLYRDDNIVIVDKPHFLATMPRGRHVAQTALVRLRRELGLPELSPAHRLDRLTAGVLSPASGRCPQFTTRRELRGAYQRLFARGEVHKTYLARAAVNPDVVLPRVVRSRIVKRRGQLQAVCEPGEANAETLVELVSPDGRYRLTPRTGRTHQLRVHMASLGVPIHGDPLYPSVIDVPADDFSTPLQLLAHRIGFEDPVSGVRREFVSRRQLPDLVC